jgi:hypothetical protein
LDGLSPPIGEPSKPTLAKRAGSSRPMDELVGEIKIPSSSLTEILPLDPQP